MKQALSTSVYTCGFLISINVFTTEHPPKVSFTSAHPQHVREFLSHVLQHTLHGKDSFLLAPHHLYLNFYLGPRPFINHISKLSVRMKFLSLAIFVGLFLAACVSCSVAAKSSNNNCKEQCKLFLIHFWSLWFAVLNATSLNIFESLKDSKPFLQRLTFCEFCFKPAEKPLAVVTSLFWNQLIAIIRNFH